MKNPRWAVFLSGQGSTAQAFFDLKNEIDLRLVVSNRVNALGVKRARRAGLPTLYFSKEMSWEHLALLLRSRGISAIFLLGFMKIVPAFFTEEFLIVNIHPSLLPDFPGLHAIEKTYAHPAAAMGVTVHRVTPGVDEGPRILQSRVIRPEEKKNFSFPQARFKIARAEQRLIRE